MQEQNNAGPSLAGTRNPSDHDSDTLVGVHPVCRRKLIQNNPRITTELYHQDHIIPRILYQLAFVVSCMIYINHYTLFLGPGFEFGRLTQRRLSFQWWSQTMHPVKLFLLSHPSHPELQPELRRRGSS